MTSITWPNFEPDPPTVPLDFAASIFLYRNTSILDE